jgi:hypothetical protein
MYSFCCLVSNAFKDVGLKVLIVAPITHLRHSKKGKARG